MRIGQDLRVAPGGGIGKKNEAEPVQGISTRRASEEALKRIRL